MSWAKFAIEKLKMGEKVQIRPRADADAEFAVPDEQHYRLAA